MKAKYRIKSREEGRGKWSVKSFKTLGEASEYIQARWQGTEYCDGRDGFHTDYCEYVLHGFTLYDLGRWVGGEYGAVFAFTELSGLADAPVPSKARIIAQEDTRPASDHEVYHFRASEAYIAHAKAKDDGFRGVWTDEEYQKQFNGPYVPADPKDEVARTVEEQHTEHKDPEHHLWCPLCQQICRARAEAEEKTNPIPF